MYSSFTSAPVLPQQDALTRENIIDSTYRAKNMADYVPQEETVRIAINLGGGLDFDCKGSRFLSTDVTNNFDCAYREFAAKKGIASNNYNPKSYTSRAEAVKSLVIAAGMTTSTKDIPYTDIAGEKGYISRAYEVGCIGNDSNFRPNDLISRGDMLSLSDCIHTVALSSVTKTPTQTAISSGNLASTNVVSTSTSSDTGSSTNSIQASQVSGATSASVSKTVIIDRTVTVEKLIPATGGIDQLPKSPNTLLGYDQNGNIQNIRIGS